MHPDRISASKHRPSAAEILGLRGEISQLRAERDAAMAENLALAATHRESQACWHTYFYHLPLAQLVLDAELIIRQANPALLALLGFSQAADLVGNSMLDFAPSDRHADWHRLPQHLAVDQQKPFLAETCLIRHNGSPLHCQLSATPAPDEQGAWSCVSITALAGPATLARQLSAEEYEAIRHAISHNLRAPIAHIQLLVELLQRQAARPVPDPEKAAQYLKLIHYSCTESSALIKETLRLVDGMRTEAG